MATLERFLQSGELGFLHVGMTQEEAIARLGPPLDVSALRSKSTRILKYSALQLNFGIRPGEAASTLNLIGLYFVNVGEPIPESVRPTDFDASSETTVEGFRRYLAAIGLGAVETKLEELDDFLTPCRTRVTFRYGKLWRMLFSVQIPQKRKKQIAIAVSEETWQKLNALGQQSNRSVAEVCSNVVTQHANVAVGEGRSG